MTFFSWGNIRGMCLHLSALCRPLASIHTGEHLKAIKELLEIKMQLNAINKKYINLLFEWGGGNPPPKQIWFYVSHLWGEYVDLLSFIILFTGLWYQAGRHPEHKHILSGKLSHTARVQSWWQPQKEQTLWRIMQENAFVQWPSEARFLSFNRWKYYGRSFSQCNGAEASRPFHFTDRWKKCEHWIVTGAQWGSPSVWDRFKFKQKHGIHCISDINILIPHHCAGSDTTLRWGS